MTFGRVGIIGDSYSTFAGCVPEGYFFYYAPDKHLESGVVRREQTWWDLLIRETGSTLVINDSFSGSTVCCTGRPDHPAWSAFALRAPRVFDGSVPLDTIFFLGGTNDSWIDSHPVDQPRDRVHQDTGGQLAAGQDVVADRDLLVGVAVDRALIHPLVVSAEQDR